MATPSSIRALVKGTPEYKPAYRRGWAAGERGSDGAQERADARNEPDAWYDDYGDSVNGRKKWHRKRCLDHEISCIGWNK